MMTSWVAVCQFCGKQGSRQTTANGRKPAFTPTIPGKCPSSLNGKHSPKWEER